MTGEIGGGKPLTRDLVRERLEFLPTATEFKFKDAQQLVIHKTQVGGGLDTIYTVPSRHEFYITTVAISSHNTGANEKGCSLRIDGAHLLLQAVTNTHGEANISLSYPFPVKLDENQVLDMLGTDASVDSTAFITGFLISKSIV